jgi:tRNA threonylcarbamoyladenosine biosynthesis protein TsaE
MLDVSPPATDIRMVLADEAATARLAAAVAKIVQAGDVIALHGTLGAGKTSFARGFIAALGGGPEVPSPTFTLVQIYDVAPAPVWHFDLYRTSAPDEALELGIEEAFVEAISLIEWPERLGSLLPSERLDIALDFGAGETERHATLTGQGAWRRRLEALRLES